MWIANSDVLNLRRLALPWHIWDQLPYGCGVVDLCGKRNSIACRIERQNLEVQLLPGPFVVLFYILDWTVINSAFQLTSIWDWLSYSSSEFIRSFICHWHVQPHSGCDSSPQRKDIFVVEEFSTKKLDCKHSWHSHHNYAWFVINLNKQNNQIFLTKQCQCLFGKIKQNQVDWLALFQPITVLAPARKWHRKLVSMSADSRLSQAVADWKDGTHAAKTIRRPLPLISLGKRFFECNKDVITMFTLHHYISSFVS